MESEIIRNKLQQYINEGDDKLLQLMYAIANEYKVSQENNRHIEFSEEDLMRYEIRRLNRLDGKSKIHDWSEAKDMIKASVSSS